MRAELIAVATGILIILALAGWAGAVVDRFIPNREGYAPVLFFDSQEKYLPCTIDFDGDWDTANNYFHYDRGKVPIAIYTKTYERENYVVFGYFFYYAYNDFVNVHQNDAETCFVFTKSGAPVFIVRFAHGKPSAQRIYSIHEDYAYVQRGSHALYGSLAEAFPCDGYERVLPSEIQFRDVMEAYAHRGEFEVPVIMGGERVSVFKYSVPGDVDIKPWWYYDWFWEPERLLDNQQREEIAVGASAVPLSWWGVLPRATTVVTSLPFFLAGSFVAGFLFRRGCLVLTIVAVLVVVAIVVGCLRFYGPAEVELSTAMAILRNSPYALGVIGASAMGFALRTLAGRRIGRW
jgi:hypothetical protein